MSQIGHRPHLQPFERVDRPVVGYARDYPAATDTGLHAHPRAQLLYATSGVMAIEAERASFLIPPGTGLYVPADTAHAVHMSGEVAMRALFLRGDATPAGPACVSAIAVSPLLRELILAACDEPLEWDLGGRGQHLAALAIDEIGRAATLPLSLPMPSDLRLRRVTDALLHNPTDPSSLEVHAAVAAASSRTLGRLFRRETGMSFQQWRRHLRLTRAMAALVGGSTPAQAAFAAGYASTPAFGAAFRTAFGSTPGALRQARGEPRSTPGVATAAARSTSMAEDPKPTGTTGAPNPKTGSSDAARGIGGHSKDASHAPAAPAEYVEDGEPAKP